MNSMEIHGAYNGFADKGCDPKFCYLAGFYINLCSIHFCDSLSSYRNRTKDIASAKIIVESLHFTTMALNFDDNSIRFELFGATFCLLGLTSVFVIILATVATDVCAKDSGKELLTKVHIVRITIFKGLYRNSI